jgi:hypothetical protein
MSREVKERILKLNRMRGIVEVEVKHLTTFSLSGLELKLILLQGLRIDMK